MKIISLQKTFKLIIKLEFALLNLGLIAACSSLGSFIEQDEPSFFYEENYPLNRPIYGFITSKFILFLGLDHVYTTWWFLGLLGVLAISLTGCSITRQFPLLNNSKEYFFRKQKVTFLNLPFSIKLKNFFYLKETILLKLQNLNFYVYQKGNLVYGYKGLIGRISPILVHVSLLIVLGGSTIGAFKNFKAQEMLPKGEIFHVQNPIKIGWLTPLPTITTRINDFWVEYQGKKIHQFYSNLSVLDNFGNEIKNQTISVNNPLRYKQVDFYQSDWNLIGIRVKQLAENRNYEFPVFPLQKASKSWITWIKTEKINRTVIFDQLENTFLLYDETGKFLNLINIGEEIENEWMVNDLLPSTGLLVKYDPSISIIYLGFGLLMITSLLSYLPYTQFWIFEEKNNVWIGTSTNRGKIQLEIEFENLLRELENKLGQNSFQKV
jgi:cytochrome c biogenesis protein